MEIMGTIDGINNSWYHDITYHGIYDQQYD